MIYAFSAVGEHLVSRKEIGTQAHQILPNSTYVYVRYVFLITEK